MNEQAEIGKSEVKKWKAEIWMEDNVGEGIEPLTQRQIDIAMESAKRAIETEWDDLKVIDFDIYIDKEDDLSKREGL